MTWKVHVLAWLLPGLLLVGCGGEPEVITLRAMYDDERALPAIYIVDGGGEQVIAAGDQGILIHEGQLAWPALTCANPACPEHTDGDEPYLFIAPDPAIVLQANGDIGYDRSRDTADNHFGNCPACLKTRNLGRESDEDRQQYSNWAIPHVLPTTSQRRQELAAARQAREEELRHRMVGGAG